MLVAMRFGILLCLVYFDLTECMLWPKGVVHYAINPKDYDLHSQDEILAAIDTLEKEICVKFFNTPFNYSASTTDKILYISNPDKQKNCPPEHYNYTGTVVDMPIGYKCLNKKEIARIIVDMLRASIDQTVSTVNSYDLVKLFEEQDQAKQRSTFLTTEDRNYINAHYHAECSSLTSRAPARRAGQEEDFGGITLANLKWYHDKVWPLGIVMYSVDETMRNTTNYKQLIYAMTQIELVSCVVFHETRPTDPLAPNNQLLLQREGADTPALGFQKGDQRLSLSAMTLGAPGHSAHTLNNLLRVLGLPMMSNRFDRDNYVSINWSKVKTGREHLLEKVPRNAWLESVSYDFDSATHAPVNYMCAECAPGVTTVRPLLDFLWQRSLQMGHKAELSPSDKKLLNMLYAKQCKNRFMPSI